MKEINMHSSSLGSSKSWIKFTELIGSKNNVDFNFFRRHPVMIKGVEGTNYISLLQNIDSDNLEYFY